MNAPLKSIKGYELRERIGTGGFGAVYKAYQTTIGRDVAIKVILPDRANHPEFIRRFEGEAQMVARLEHPHIVPLYDYWRDPDGAYLVMRWLRGGSLRDALVNGPFDLPSAARLIDQIAGALALAHRSGVIHRDVKPGNILLDEDGNAYLTDFGIAKDLSVADGATAEDAILGSLDYISPEQARSAPVSPRTDIYSLGVTLYEMLTGQHPFLGLSAVERLYKHINDPLPAITLYDAPVRDAVNAVITTATAKNPEMRYPDVLAMAAELRAAAGQTAASLEEVLTLREQEILALVIDGLANKEIAHRLTLTLGTVKWHVNQIYAKLGVRSRVQAIVRSRELNLIRRGEDAVNTVAGMVNVPTVRIPTEEFHPVNPYKGLLAFQSADHQDFYGRDKLIARLIRRLSETGDYHRFLAVVGPSGSGKSSLVKAGLIPALWRGDLPRAERWFVVEMMPGAHPLDELEIALLRVSANQAGNLNEQLRRDERGLVRAAGLILPADGTELVLVIDQFEEVYTLAADDAERQQFLDLLYTVVTEARSRVRVIITLRADFYDRPLHDPRFGELVHSRLETILPLSAEELEQAITRPAERVGVSFEPGLVTTIVGEVNYQPGALPLLQYALTELFEAREGRVLTREAYHQIGGTVGALARRADEVFLGLTGREQAAAQQIFLRLVTLGEGTEDTRRRAPRSELKAVVEDADLLDDIIEAFTAYRLLALDTDPGTRTPTVELAHEALIREWERLRGWLNDAREDIKLQRQIAALAADWHEHERDPGLLVRGSRLRQFMTWADETSMALTSREREYLAASAAEQTRQQEAEAAQQQREAALERRSRTLLRGLAGVLALALVGALILSGIALSNADEAARERDAAQAARATSDANFARAERQRLALVANEAMDRGAPGNVGLALALRSLAMGYSEEADAALSRASRQGTVMRSFTGHDFDVYTTTYSPDGSLLATTSEGGTRVYRVETGEELRLLPASGIVYTGAFSPDGDLFVAAGNSGQVDVYDTQMWDVRATLPIDEDVLFAYFMPDGEHVILDSDLRLMVWNTTSGEVVSEYPANGDGDIHRFGMITDPAGRLYFLIREANRQFYLQDAETNEITCLLLDMPQINRLSVGFWFDPSILVIAPYDPIDGAYPIDVWDFETCTRISQFTAHSSNITAFDYSPATDTIISADNDGSVFLWNYRTGIESRRMQTPNVVWEMTFAPDGATALISDFNVVLEYDLRVPNDPFVLTTHPRLMNSTVYPRFAPDGQSLFIGGFGAMEQYALATPGANPLFVFEQPIRVADLSPDGRLLVAPLEAYDNFDLHVIDTTTGDSLRQLAGFTEIGNFTDISPDGRMVASGSFDMTARIWDLETGETLHVLTGHTGVVSSAVFSADGTFLATSSSDGTIRIWDTATGETLHILEIGQPQAFVDISPDGQRIVTGTTDPDHAYIIDIATGETLHTLIGHNGTVWTTRFSPDGSLVATASWDGTARIWDASTGALIRVLDNRTGRAINYVEFSPDGAFVMTGGEREDRVYLWRVNLDDVVAALCARPIQDLSPEEREQYGITDEGAVCPDWG